MSIVLRVGFGVVATLALISAARAEQLPVYKLAPAQVDAKKAEALFTDAFAGVQGKPQPALRGMKTTWGISAGQKAIEVDKRSGYFFLADDALFLNGDAKSQAPDEGTARKVAETFLQKHALLPQGAEVKTKFSGVTMTGYRQDTDSGPQERVLDRHINYDAVITANGRELPVVGGGGQFKVIVGDGGRIVAYAGGWRAIEGVAETVEVKSEKEALADYLLAAGNPKVKNVKMYLAYYAAPSFEAQQYLSPVWVLSGQIATLKGDMKLRIQIIPATKYGPAFGGKKSSGKKRVTSPKDRPEEPSDDGEQPLQKRSLLDLIITPAQAVEVDADCSSWWITDGLPRVYANRQGFFDGCRAQGFTPRYDWGDVNAWESDWTTYDDNEGPDTADVVFYTGHADSQGWVLMTPDDGGLSPGEVGMTGGVEDRYGRGDLEHLIIAACGPHQSRSFTSGVDYADTRWRAIFNGLHTFEGYGSVTFDTDSEGRRFMELIRSGRSVIYSWIRTGIDIQPGSNGEVAPDGPTIYVTSIKASHRTISDRSICISDETLTPRRGCTDIRAADIRLAFIYAAT